MRRQQILLFLLAGLFLSGWGHSGPKVKVGLVRDLNAVIDNPSFFEKIDDSIKDQNASLLIERLIEMSGSIQFQSVLEKGAQAIVLILNGPRATEVAAEIRKKGLPIITVNRPVPGDSQDFLVAYDPRKEGASQAQGVLAKAPKGLYLVVGKVGEDWFRKAFREGQLEALKGAVVRGDIRISTSPKDLPKAAAVLTFGDEEARDWTGKIAKAGLEGKVVLGTVGQYLHTCKAILAGKPLVSVYESPIKLAEETAYLAVKAARKAKEFDCQFSAVPNGKGTVRTVLLTPKGLDASTLEGTVIKEGVWTKERLLAGAKP